MRRGRPAWVAPVAQAVLVAGPVAVLVVLGAYFLRQDWRWVETEARANAEELGHRMLRALVEGWTNVPGESFSAVTNRWPEGVAFTRVDTNLDLVFPPPRVNAAATSPKFSEAQSNLWARAEAAEYESNDWEGALGLVEQLIGSALEANADAAARFHRAVLLERAGRTNEMENLARTVPLSARLDSGMPVAHVAGFKVLSKGKVGADFARWHASKLLAEPTEFTDYFLRQEQLQWAREVWVEHERARAFPRSAERSATAEGGRWFRIGGGTNWVWRSEENALALMREVVLRERVPEQFRFAWFVGNTPVGAPESGAAFASAGGDEIRCAIVLAGPDALFMRQRQRAWLFGGLLAGSALVAVAGVVHTFRSYRKQERLNELKSNFVASVSHELRAPLASMRLLSEGLQGGRVTDATKQREYFNFLVQECRRLSGLIENVLDFSRIEQGRKSYEFELVDLRRVVEAAVRTVSPMADERRARLDFEPGNEEMLAQVDVLAMQQAVMNVLDNAVKHSAPGGTVSVQTRLDRTEVAISVRDQGPGIDAKEHERIFERFHRLGSEQRRETQGVGIGLSIVKHTVEAHRGSVTVTSAPGSGSTFTIRVPRP
jgi:signal transduction histidine kinase